MSANDYLELGKKPISEDQPGGESCRDDMEYDELATEVGKLSRVDGGSVDWRKVVTLSADLLDKRSKDLMVASYFTVGLMEREGYKGLAVGIGILRDLVTDHWENLFPPPKRMKGRKAAFQWLGDRGSRLVAARNAGAGDAEAVNACVEGLSELEDGLRAHLEDGADDLVFDLVKAMKAVQQTVKSAEAQKAQPAAAAPAAGGGGPAITTVESPADATKALTEAQNLVKKVAEFLRKAEPNDPLAYRLPRSAIWMPLNEPIAHTNGETTIPPYQPPDAGDKIQESLDKEEWDAVIEAAEMRFPILVFWLDLHRFTAQALEGRGEAGAAAAEGICQELGLLLRRFPGLQDLKFAGGIPMADDETRKWIQERVLVGGGGGGDGGGGDGGASTDADELADAVRDARKLAKKKKLAEALTLLQKGAAGAGSLRKSARWKLALAQLLLDTGPPETALHQFEALDDSLQRSSFEDWDPEFSAELLQSLYTCQQKVITSTRQPSPELVQRAQAVLARLSRLDVVSALSLGGK